MAWTAEWVKVCSVENCGKSVRCKGLCSLHYARMYVQGRTHRIKQSREGFCSVDACEEPIKGLRFCNKHYQLFKRNGKPEKVIRERVKHPYYHLWFERKQNDDLCREWLDFSEFVKGIGEKPEGNFFLTKPHHEYQYSPANFEWIEQLAIKFDETNKEFWARKWKDARVRNPDIEYERNLQRSFGISLDQYLEKFKNQNSVCAICNEPETSRGKGGTLRRLAVDHCHTENKIRELLCGRCNKILGAVNDSIELLEKMKQYLIKHKD